jgi:hypothetical protein
MAPFFYKPIQPFNKESLSIYGFKHTCGFYLALFLLWLFIPQSDLIASPGYGAERGGNMTNIMSWPRSMMGWSWDQEDKVYDRETLFDYIDGAAEVFLAYNFQKAHVHRYVKRGQPDMVAEVYEMGSSADAYGVFSLERQDPEVGIGQGSEFGGSLLRFWKGKTFVSILGEGAGKEIEEVVLSLGRDLAARIKESGDPPRLLRYIAPLDPFLEPDRLYFVRSHVLLNRRFFISHQNILQMGSDVQAVLARYSRGQEKTHLLLIRYPSEAKAASAFNSFKSAYLPESGADNVLRTEESRWTKLERFREFLMIVFGSQSPSEAARIIQYTITKIKEEEP